MASNGMLQSARHHQEGLGQPLLGYEDMQERILVVGGVIQASEKIRLSKLCFRATRGKAFVQFYDMRLPEEDLIADGIKNSQQAVYLVLFENGGNLKERV